MFKFKIENFEKEAPERICELMKKNPGALESEEEMTVLTQFVKRRAENVTVQKNYCCALRQLCSTGRGAEAAVQRASNSGCVQTVLEAMDRHRGEAQLQALGFEVIGAIARQDPINALLQVGMADGVRVIVGALGMYPRDARVEVPGLWMLGTLSRDVEIARSLLDYNGLEIIKGIICDNMRVIPVLLPALTVLINVILADVEGTVGAQVARSVGIPLFVDLLSAYGTQDVFAALAALPAGHFSDDSNGNGGNGGNGDGGGGGGGASNAAGETPGAVLMAVLKLLVCSLRVVRRQSSSNGSDSDGEKQGFYEDVDEDEGDDGCGEMMDAYTEEIAEDGGDDEGSGESNNDDNTTTADSDASKKKRPSRKKSYKKSSPTQQQPTIQPTAQQQQQQPEIILAGNEAAQGAAKGPLLRALVNVMRAGGSSNSSSSSNSACGDAQVLGCRCLGEIGYGVPRNCAKILRDGGVDALLDLIRQRKDGGGAEGDPVLEAATEALASLALDRATGVAVCERMGVALLVKTLWGWRGAAGVQANGCLCLGALAREPRARAEIGYSGGVRHVTGAVHTHKDSLAVQKAGLLALGYLALNPANRAIITSVSENGVHVIVGAMRRYRASAAVQTFAAAALANLTASPEEDGSAAATAATAAVADAGAVELAVGAMGEWPAAPALQAACCRLLGNVACAGRAAAERVALACGCDALVRAVTTFAGLRGASAAAALRAAFSALANIAGAPSKSACERMCDAGLPDALIRAALAHAASSAAQRAALRLAANAAVASSTTRSRLRKAGVVHPTLGAMVAFPADPEVQHEGARVVAALAGAGSGSARDDLLEGGAVPALIHAVETFPTDPEILRNCCAALKSLAAATDCIPRMCRDGLSLPSITAAVAAHVQNAASLAVSLSPTATTTAAASTAAAAAAPSNGCVPLIKACCAILGYGALYGGESPAEAAMGAIRAGAVRAVEAFMVSTRDSQAAQAKAMFALAALLASDEARRLAESAGAFDPQAVAALIEEPLVRYGAASKKIRDFAAAILRCSVENESEEEHCSAEMAAAAAAEASHDGKRCKQKDGRYCQYCSTPQTLYACKTCQKEGQRVHLYCSYCWKTSHAGHIGTELFFVGKCESSLSQKKK